MRKIKLIWDFRGIHSLKTAEHHVIHLREFVDNNCLPIEIIDSKIISELHSIAYMVINESDMVFYRDHLKPHRGEIYVS